MRCVTLGKSVVQIFPELVLEECVEIRQELRRGYMRYSKKDFP